MFIVKWIPNLYFVLFGQAGIVKKESIKIHGF
jgi:hypothetical protein